METTFREAPIAQERSHELVKLVRKLRWIGMEEEARQLQRVLSTLPAGERASMPDWQSTD